MHTSNRKVDKAPAASQKANEASRGSKFGSFVRSDAVPGYAGVEDATLMPQLPIPSPIMPYYGQYSPICALSPGAAPMGFSMPPQTGTGSPQMWIPGMVPPPPGANSNATLTPHPYVSPYGAGAQPMVYLPLPYSYPPCMAATTTTSAPALGASFNGQQSAKAAAQGATPPYTSTTAALHQSHSGIGEPPNLSPPFMEAPSTNSTAPTPSAVLMPASVPSITTIELSAMPLMPNTVLPPGDPFCPAGVAVPSQYATASALCFSDAPAADELLSVRSHRCNNVANGFPAVSQQSEMQATPTDAVAADLNAP
ncbi:hypothetical protein Q4I28_005748 [Leishmania naiffi]|uniref:Uncharacterized protein n=1 Tax=Leishmania naiffi TaxID=5678 RepID=A0AAW3BIR2_9TRYP